MVETKSQDDPVAEVRAREAEVKSRCAQAGLPADAGNMARVSQIADLCSFAGVPDQAAEFIASGVSLAEVRRLLIDAKAEMPEEEPIVGAHAGGYRAPSSSDPHGWDAIFAKVAPHRFTARGDKP
jgi:hypothetical protein